MSDIEVMTILVLFHTSGCRTLKVFYHGWVCLSGRAGFLRVFPMLLLFLRICAQGRSPDAPSADSSSLEACHPKRTTALH